MNPPPAYPALRFLLRYGNAIAWLVSIALVLAGLGLGASGGWMAGAALVASGLLAFLFIRAATELVHIVADTLLPPAE